MIHPSDVKGPNRTKRKIIGWVLIAFFVLLPWLRINGSPLIRFDFDHKLLILMGLKFWLHDIPLLFLVIASGILTIAFVTAIWGRAWCGYTCPQTVFIEHIFRPLERLIEGDGLSQRKLDAAPWTFDKLLKRSLKWGIYLVVASLIAHSFLDVLVGPEALAKLVHQSPAEALSATPGLFIFTSLITGLILFDFSFFRETFCINLCPYARFQSILMDDRTSIIAYDTKRDADCVQCNRCVQVCPTGIDIRKGLQLECVACTSCMDACDEVMHRVHRPKKLIAKTSARWSPRRTILLIALLSAVSVLGMSISKRKDLDVQIVRSVQSPFKTTDNGLVLNHFALHLENQGFEPLTLAFEAPAPIEIVVPQSNSLSLTLTVAQAFHGDLYVKFPQSLLNNGSLNSYLLINKKRVDLSLIGPSLGKPAP